MANVESRRFSAKVYTGEKTEDMKVTITKGNPIEPDFMAWEAAKAYFECLGRIVSGPHMEGD